MHQAVHAADIHERTVVGQALDNARVLLADFHIGPELLALGVVLGGQDLADGTHDVAAFALLHLQADIRFHQGGIILAMAQRGLGARHEHAHVIHQHHNAAGVGLGDEALQDLAALDSGGNGLAALVLIQTLFGKIDDAFLVVYLCYDEVELVTFLDQILRFGGRVIGEFLELDETGLLRADIHLDLAGGNAGDDALYDLSIVYRLQGSVDHFLKAQFLFTNFLAHTAQYLLNNRRGRGCTRRHSHRACAAPPRGVQLLCCLHGGGLCMAPGNGYEFLGVGGLPPADDDHQVALARKALRLMLPRPCCITYCIKYARICIYFFEKLYAFLPLFHLKSGLSYHKNSIFGIFWS